jgi:hypothetical protein
MKLPRLIEAFANQVGRIATVTLMILIIICFQHCMMYTQNEKQIQQNETIIELLNDIDNSNYNIVRNTDKSRLP